MDVTGDNILRVIIHHCDNLKPKILLLQPALCMHVIDVKTGTYVKKSDRNRAVVSFYENQRNDVDYIMPVMTQSCSLSEENFTVLRWEEVFILNEQYSRFTDKESSIILFFEILDLITISHTKYLYERLNQNGMHKIAWAFLKILGCNDVVNIGGKMRLQLYKPFKPLKKKNKSPVEVFSWWLKKPRISMEASLYVTIEPYATFTAEPALRSMLPVQQERGSTTFEKLSSSDKASSLPLSQDFKSIAVDTLENEVIWTRKIEEPCEIPRKKKLSLDIINCCQILKFSSHGRFLVAGCGSYDSYYLLFYQIPNGKLLHKILAHSELIYDLDWSHNDKYLLSASGDYTVKLWNLKYWSLKQTFVHPSYVYSAKFHPDSEKIFASSCYDHIIRIWAVEGCQLINELECHNSTTCTLCWNSYGTRLYSADGIGQIKVWQKVQKDSYRLENEFSPEETKGISINRIVLDSQEQTLCLFCSDSVPRILSLKNGTILCSFESEVSTQKVCKGCCSPCGNLLFLCCDKGMVTVWSNKNYDKNNSELLHFENYGALSCIEFHPYEHMLALSFWDEGVPIHVYIHENPEQENKVVHTTAINTDEVAKTKTNHLSKKEKSYNLKQNVSSEEQLTSGAHIDVASYSSSKSQRAAKYRTHKFDETSTSDSVDVHSTKVPEDNKKELLTAVITKSGNFDIIAVADDSACSDSNTFRSLNSDPIVLNRSSKRSQRRKKLRDMNKVLF